MAASYVRIGQDEIASNLLAEVVVQQQLNAHWTCRVEYRATLDSRPEVEQMHGQPLRIATLGLDGTEHVIFSGIIRGTHLAHEVWGSYTAQVEAVSFCWLMDLGQHYAYYLKQSPQQIAQTLTGNSGLALTGSISGDATPSRVQWSETDYDFLHQLADDGEAWLRPTEGGVETQANFQPGVTVQWRQGEYGLLEFQTAGRVTPRRIDGAHYDATAMQSQRYGAIQSEAVFYPDAVPQLVGKALAASAATATGAHPGRNRAITLDHYQQRLQLESRRAAVNSVTCQGVSREPQVTAGNEIVVAGLPGASGTYGVIACTHRWTSKGYENHFTATPAKRWFAPVRVPRASASGLYPARVAANHDPHNQGRMQIQYWWLEETPTTWARLLTAHAGADRGLLWYPELGDEVTVRFEQGDPERPIIVGSVWNGIHQPPTEGYWHTGNPNDVEFASNNIKRIVTKSGIRITLNDTPGQESITLATPTSNHLTMTEKTNETGRPALVFHTAGDILVSAPNGRIHSNSATHSREVGSTGSAQGGFRVLPDSQVQSMAKANRMKYRANLIAAGRAKARTMSPGKAKTSLLNSCDSFEANNNRAEMARISASVYNFNGAPEGWTRVDPKDMPQNLQDRNLWQNPTTHFRAGLYRSSIDPNKYVVATAGTSNAKDLTTDIGQAFGLDTKQYDSAQRLAEQLRSSPYLPNLQATGHSLGGGEAALIGSMLHVPTTTLNAAGLHPETLARAGLTSADLTTVTNLEVPGQVVGELQGTGPNLLLAPSHLAILAGNDIVTATENAGIRAGNVELNAINWVLGNPQQPMPKLEQYPANQTWRTVFPASGKQVLLPEPDFSTSSSIQELHGASIISPVAGTAYNVTESVRRHLGDTILNSIEKQKTTDRLAIESAVQP
jgi:type VI secretion system secreted protein VgrG